MVFLPSFLLGLVDGLRSLTAPAIAGGLVIVSHISEASGIPL
jgi:uncharacterized membrane protein